MTLSHPSTDNPRSTRSTPLTDLKDILIFLDGTGKDGALDSGNSHPTTNVWQLYLMAESIDSGHLKRKRISLYIPGLRLELTNTGRSFLEKWRLCERPLSWIPSEEPPKTPIAVECIGVWDTVGAVYNPVFRLKQNIIGTPDDEQVTPGIKFKPSL
ncbi:hypothetical protein RhiXN_03638 [Rhizoctonia solani]|uniref:Uncharacterized protein n=1 Tax=Rhizoctonia solani TaxID=456999 RepID=A0A8H8NN21_9AGAM|nr:uncharacterized protein RhiXN_03638 [Rhizoctonia solani]QRW15637.1 hypothetical protein RhiXN_03638 [Rhizoctonia solani]